MERCAWGLHEPELSYHDTEWGVPLHNDNALYEFLVLEGAQAGLSWQTILKRRETYRSAFEQFDPQKVAGFDQPKVETLMSDAGIIRNRRKIESAIQNARAFLAVQQEFGSFDAYVWCFVGGKPRQNGWRPMQEIPTTTPEATALSKDLVRRGFSFVGATICYAFMQAVGLVNDHTTNCFRYEEIKKLGYNSPIV
jgi:DNA-3-methyladenine glycosylase I